MGYQSAGCRRIGARIFDFSREAAVMAIVNRTPDSFFDQGSTFAFDKALDAVIQAVRDGALCEDGPTLFGALLEADCVDELCLTISPLIEAGAAPRIAAGALPEARRMTLHHFLVAGSTLLLRYQRLR